MGKNPYSDLPKSAFWKTGVAQENPYAIEGIYKKKFDILASAKIATAGSCFAQHISRHLKKNGYNVLDVEPPPPGLPEDCIRSLDSRCILQGTGIFTLFVSYCNLLKRLRASGPQNYIWEKNESFLTL